jgi:cell division protein ZapA
MPNVDVEIGNRRYSIACRAGEEEHLRAVAAIVDRKAQDAVGALGTLGEARQLLFASLLLADEVQEQRSGGSGAGGAGGGSQASPFERAEADVDAAVAASLERLAQRVEMLADRLEATASSS